MNLYISAAEYDYHTLLKVAEMAGLAGIIGFHEAGDGYLVTFPQGENVQALIDARFLSWFRCFQKCRSLVLLLACWMISDKGKSPQAGCGLG